jgi:hypothetical protein
MLAQSSSGSWYRSARLIASIAGGRYGTAGLIAASPSVRVGRDRLGAWQGLGVRRVHLQVVDDTAVDQFGLGRGHSDDPVASGELAARADVCRDIGIAWTRLSVPKASHGSGRTACRHRAIPDLPELDPPLSTIT